MICVHFESIKGSVDLGSVMLPAAPNIGDIVTNHPISAEGQALQVHRVEWRVKNLPSWMDIPVGELYVTVAYI